MSALTPKVGSTIMSSHIYPVESIYECMDDTNPQDLFGGTWEQIYADYDKIYLGTQLIYPEISVNDTEIIGSFSTWSDETFRGEWLSSLIEFGVDILPKSTTDLGYTSDGYVYTLYSVNNNSMAYKVYVYGLMQHVYAASNDKIYRWRRIS